MTGHDSGAADEQVEVLAGGNMGAAVRVGTSVRRSADAWSPTIQRLLRHLRHGGLTWVPEPLGRDADGRDSVSYLPGEVPQYPLPDWVWRDHVCFDAARHLAQMHAATTDFDSTDAVWQLPAHEPIEVVCHNDFAPYNMVFTDGRLSGVIDWDTCSPGPRVWDLAYLAYRLVPLTDPANSDGLDSDVHQRARRLRLICDAYSHGHSYGPEPAQVLDVAVQRLRDLAALTQTRADCGQKEVADHVDLYRRDAAWITAHATDLGGNAGDAPEPRAGEQVYLVEVASGADVPDDSCAAGAPGIKRGSPQPAEPADAAGLLALREAASAWLAVHGVRQWEPGEVTVHEVRRQVAAGEWHVLRDSDGLVAALRLLWEDDQVWGPQPPVAAYVHGLMVAERRRRAGLGAALLRWAAEQARTRGRSLLRLDCGQDNAALRRYYTQQGFWPVGQQEAEGRWYSVVLLERQVADLDAPAPAS